MAEPVGAARNSATETAARHLVTRVPRAAPDERADAVLARLAGQAFDCAESVCVLGATGDLEGLVPLTRLLAAAPGARLVDLVLRPTPAVAPDTDQETVANAAIRHGIAAVPVVDAARRLLGVVPPQALLEVLRHEHVEDLHRLAGIARESLQARAALEAPPFRGVRDRLPWLLVGLAGSTLAAGLMAGFEASLQANVAISFFVPGIVYLADAIGTQSEAIAVRGLSLSHTPVRRLLLGELRTGLLLGLGLAAPGALGVWLWLGEPRLAAAVGIAVVTAGTVATTIGFVFPWLLASLGRDPAFGSGPLATVIQDVLSLVIYFAAVGWVAA